MTILYEFFRNATAKLTYNGQTLLLDPMLSPKHALPTFAGIEPNPTIELPIPVEQIVSGIDAVIVSHMHPDHFDPAAAEALSKEILIITPDNQAPMDPRDSANTIKSFVEQLQALGFTNIETIGASLLYQGITISEVFAQHGAGILSQLMGGVNGLILQAEGQPTIYLTSDTILDEGGEVENILAQYKPDLIVANTGGPVIQPVSPDPLLMDDQQAVEFIKLAKQYNPASKIIAVHMNALDHCFTTKDKLRSAIATLSDDIQQDVIIPAEGETVTV